MNYLKNFNPEKIDSIPAVKQQLRFLKKAIDDNEIGNDSDAYRKPKSGIPVTDLSIDIQQSLNKANNAVPAGISTTYSELKSLRDNSQLIPGCWYRITDYECTTTQEDTRSAGHQFDILVLATSVNTLSEEARAIQHESSYDDIYVDDGDHYIYTGRKVTVHFSDVTKELYLWHLVVDDNFYIGFYSELSPEELKQLTQEQLNETLWMLIDDAVVISENEINSQYYYEDDALEWPDVGFTIYSFDSYFSKCNLNAWKIWYCLDNDTNRFAWAKNGLYPAYISTPNILDGEHLEFQGIIYIDGNPELNYGTSEQSIRHGGGDARYAGGFVFRDMNNDKSFVGKSIDDIKEAVEGDNAFAVVLMDEELDEAFNIHSEDVSEESVANEGKGVIYRMIDEWNNDCPYDFKNIMYNVPISNRHYYKEGENYKYCYTFNYYINGSCKDLVLENGGDSILCYNNIIKGTGIYYTLPKILGLTNDNDYSNGIIELKIGSNSKNIYLSEYCNNVTIGNGCSEIQMLGADNIDIHQSCNYISFDGGVQNITIMSNVSGTSSSDIFIDDSNVFVGKKSNDTIRVMNIFDGS